MIGKPWRIGLWVLTAGCFAGLLYALDGATLPLGFDDWTHPAVLLGLGCFLDAMVIPLTAGLSVSAGFRLLDEFFRHDLPLTWSGPRRRALGRS